MHHALRFVSGLIVAGLLMLAVRAYAFTIFQVRGVAPGPSLRAGDRVLVCRLAHTGLQRGSLVVFRSNGPVIGRIEAVQGDTIALNRRRYRIPDRCCGRCRCTDCRLYLVNTGGSRQLVHEQQMVGRAIRLFNLPW